MRVEREVISRSEIGKFLKVIGNSEVVLSTFLFIINFLLQGYCLEFLCGNYEN